MVITPSEVRVWQSYRNKYGPMNPVRMFDRGSAIVASQVNNAHGGKATPIDFLPYTKKEPDDIVVDEEQFITALARTGRVRYKNVKRG